MHLVLERLICCFLEGFFFHASNMAESQREHANTEQVKLSFFLLWGEPLRHCTSYRYPTILRNSCLDNTLAVDSGELCTFPNSVFF